MDDQQFRTWKTQMVPLLYDWISHHHLEWPTQAVRCVLSLAALLGYLSSGAKLAHQSCECAPLARAL